MSYVLPPRRVIQALNATFVPETPEEAAIFEAREKREAERRAAVREAQQRLLEESEARRDAQQAADAAKRARPTQILAQQLAGWIPHYELHRLTQDLGRTNLGQLVAELQRVWRIDEDQRMAGKLTKPLTSARQAELDAGAL